MVPIVLSDNRQLKRNASIAYNYQQNVSIMPAYAHVPMTTYYARNYASIIRQCLFTEEVSHCTRALWRGCKAICPGAWNSQRLIKLGRS